MRFSGGELAEIQTNMLEWARINHRCFPWRSTRNPYAVLLAEVLLHRTRAEQVVPIYQEMLKRYPDVNSLANADIEELTELLQTLGLLWRIPLLKEMACRIVDDFNGEIPPEVAKLQQLPGVGPYIAGATACFAYDQPEVILDTNTVRVLGRLTMTPVTDGSRRSKKFRTMMTSLLPKKNARLFNLGLLDLAALICRPVKPDCASCPLEKNCLYPKTPDAEAKV